MVLLFQWFLVLEFKIFVKHCVILFIKIDSIIKPSMFFFKCDKIDRNSQLNIKNGDNLRLY